MEVGQRIRNIHTGNIYTVIKISVVNTSTTQVDVYEVADEYFNSHRFNTSYLKHYEVIEEGEQ